MHVRTCVCHARIYIHAQIFDINLYNVNYYIYFYNTLFNLMLIIIYSFSFLFFIKNKT